MARNEGEDHKALFQRYCSWGTLTLLAPQFSASHRSKMRMNERFSLCGVGGSKVF
jgi:hypothetical protein